MRSIYPESSQYLAKMDSGFRPWRPRNDGIFQDHIEIEKTVLLKEVENAIYEDLKTRGLDYQSDTTKVLVRNFAVLIANKAFEVRQQ